ncbi:helix-turn-helix transcriptional regulator [Amycolatopsis sp. YIM 10]|uniref:AraC family transcriptional regulator n=1 Tax=Amycolatopsis sp. YIM 10 TaxID=2653857 RepID=UPI0012A805FF|nr:helix-turn-helix transcriptional regulator [Amycolatopsis sp. YIM 10]QFU86523.1 HTH-type transcriptional repressor of iron proteins A [Amycolatopsis sp. YIM 10]
MSSTGQPEAMLFGDYDLPSGTWLDWHVHDDHHQLAWAARGVVAVNVGSAHWVLPPARALWIPAGTVHRTGSSGNAVLRGIFMDAARSPVSWPELRLVRVRPLLRELLDHLTAGGLAEDARRRAEAVAFDLLEPVPVTPISVPLPVDPRARQVADALIATPADPRTLDDFGRAVGASERTLARLFLAETHLSFGRWRTQARLRASLPLLADGRSLATVAERVGYSSPSAFAAAFHRAVGVPPGRYFG